MARETALWAWLSKARPHSTPAIFLERIENSVGYHPDVEGYVQGRKPFWIELKTCERPARGGRLQLHTKNRKGQERFLTERAQAGQNAFMLIQVGSASKAARYLISGVYAPQIYDTHGVNETILQGWDLMPGGSVTAKQVVLQASK